jgi:hypothetical protein
MSMKRISKQNTVGTDKASHPTDLKEYDAWGK